MPSLGRAERGSWAAASTWAAASSWPLLARARLWRSAISRWVSGVPAPACTCCHRVSLWVSAVMSSPRWRASRDSHINASRRIWMGAASSSAIVLTRARALSGESRRDVSRTSLRASACRNVPSEVLRRRSHLSRRSQAVLSRLAGLLATTSSQRTISSASSPGRATRDVTSSPSSKSRGVKRWSGRVAVFL